MEYLFYCILPGANEIKVNKCQQGTINFSDKLTIFFVFFLKKKKLTITYSSTIERNN